MRDLRTLLRVSAALVVVLAADSAFAQRAMYRCASDGRAYLSDRPCDGAAPKAALAAIGPSPAPRVSGSRDQPVAKASELLDYLGAECAELREGIRNGPARGLGARAHRENIASYQRRCEHEERDARHRLAEDQKVRREMREREVASEKFERDRVKLTREQCDEMYRIAHGKRPRLATMTPGERADFDRFEATRQARCGPA